MNVLYQERKADYWFGHFSYSYDELMIHRRAKRRAALRAFLRIKREKNLIRAAAHKKLIDFWVMTGRDAVMQYGKYTDKQAPLKVRRAFDLP